MRGVLSSKELRPVYVGVLLLLLAVGADVFFDPSGALLYLCYLPALLVAGASVYRASLRNIRRGEVFDENFLMTIASIGAFAVGECAEGIAVMLFFSVGEFFEHRAVARSRAAIRALLDICPDTATVLRDGSEERIDAEDVEIGDLLVIRPGELVAVDCTVTEGCSAVNTAAITGESLPLDASAGTLLQSGFLNQSSLLYARAIAKSEESAAARVLCLVEEASENQSRQESFISKFARVYTPIVVCTALLFAILPPTALFLYDGRLLFRDFFFHALTFLVVSCPCALVISVPLSFFGGIGAAASRGVLYKGGYCIDALAHPDIAVFDKTGTLTRGVFSVTEVFSVGMEDAALLSLVSAVEHGSDHPIATALCAAVPSVMRAEGFQEHAGRGVSATVDGATVSVGNLALMREVGVAPTPIRGEGTVLYAARDGVYLGAIRMTDTLKPEARTALDALRGLGIKKSVMLTGDRRDSALAVAKALSIDECRYGLLPAEKYGAIEALKKQGSVLYVGDGINDAPALTLADVGVAMGALGSDAAIESADAVITTDELSRLPLAVRLARQNIVFALSAKLIVLLLSVLSAAALFPFNFSPYLMWIAVFADVGVAMLAILNAMRCGAIKKEKQL